MHPFLAQLAPYLTEQRQRNRSPHTLIAYERELRELANLLPATPPALPARYPHGGNIAVIWCAKAA